MITEEKAFEIIEEFYKEIQSLEPEGILALYVIGSLGGGYYRPGQSDIDTVIIVKDDYPITQEEMETIGDRYQEKYQIPKGFGAVLIRERDLFPPYLKSIEEEFEFTVEIARLKTQGYLFKGSYDLETVPMPTRDDFAADARIMERWFYSAFGYPMYDTLNTTACINSILGVLRRYLMMEKQIFEFNKFKVIQVYLENEPDIVDEEIFAYIQGYLLGTAWETEEKLYKLRDYGNRLYTHYNQKLLGQSIFS